MIVRSKRKSGYTVMSNKGLTDERLSWKARGLLAYLLSKPDDWSISERQLADAGPDGRAAVQSALAELEGHHYVKREKTRDKRGHILWVSTISDEPWSDFPTTDNPTAGKPSAGSPSADEPSAGNRTIINTDLPITEQTNPEQQSVADATAVAPPAPSLAEQFRLFHSELKNAKNRPEVLRRAYLACHGDIDVPTHGRLGTFASRVGGWRAALDAIWTCTSRPPNGDILSYLEKAKPGRGRVPMEQDEPRESYIVEPFTPERSPVAPAQKPQAIVEAAPIRPSGDPWVTALGELAGSYKGADWIAALEGSRLEAAGEARGANNKPVPFYLVNVAGGCNIRWLTSRALEQVRFKLSTILGKAVMIEFVVMQAETAEDRAE